MPIPHLSKMSWPIIIILYIILVVKTSWTNGQWAYTVEFHQFQIWWSFWSVILYLKENPTCPTQFSVGISFNYSFSREFSSWIMVSLLDGWSISSREVKLVTLPSRFEPLPRHLDQTPLLFFFTAVKEVLIYFI